MYISAYSLCAHSSISFCCVLCVACKMSTRARTATACIADECVVATLRPAGGANCLDYPPLRSRSIPMRATTGTGDAEFAESNPQESLTNLTANSKLMRLGFTQFSARPACGGWARLVEGRQYVETPQDRAHVANLGTSVRRHRRRRRRVDRRRRAAGD